jgi:hypothetical protein
MVAKTLSLMLNSHFQQGLREVSLGARYYYSKFHFRLLENLLLVTHSGY